jgi:hypothetical protein
MFKLREGIAMKALIFLLLFSPAAFGQPSYTVYKLSGVPVIPPSNFAQHTWTGEVYSRNPLTLLIDVPTNVVFTNGSLYVGNFDVYSDRTTAAVWLNGIDQPATDLTILADAPYLTEADAVDANGNTIADDFIFDRLIPPDQPQPAPNYYLLVPTTNPLQAQLTHVTAEMQFFRQGVVN